jgi:3-oxoacyl-[acyl-carrier protein] reductase
MTRLKGKTAIVTGSAVGLGRAIAVAFGGEGATVVVNYSKSQQEADETANLVREAGGEAFVIHADVSKDGEVRAMVRQTLERSGRVDVLVNNAGVVAGIPFADLDALTDEVWDAQLNVHVKGTFYCCRAVTEPMRRQGHGRIINVASVAGLWAGGSSIAYGTSKAAVVHLSKCLAKTLGPEIRVNVIAPGFIPDTRAMQNRPDLEATRKRAIAESALKRAGTSEEVAEIALFLATGADFMTGNVVVLDGGRVFR